jgi:hypothetical protein
LSVYRGAAVLFQLSDMHKTQRGTLELRSSGVLIVGPAGRSQGSTR